MANFVEQFRKDSGNEYDTLSDTQIAKAYYQKYQDDTGETVDFNEFAAEMGVDTSAPDFGSPAVQSQPEQPSEFLNAPDVAAPTNEPTASIAQQNEQPK